MATLTLRGSKIVLSFGRRERYTVATVNKGMSAAEIRKKLDAGLTRLYRKLSGDKKAAVVKFAPRLGSYAAKFQKQLTRTRKRRARIRRAKPAAKKQVKAPPVAKETTPKPQFRIVSTLTSVKDMNVLLSSVTKIRRGKTTKMDYAMNDLFLHRGALGRLSDIRPGPVVSALYNRLLNKRAKFGSFVEYFLAARVPKLFGKLKPYTYVKRGRKVVKRLNPMSGKESAEVTAQAMLAIRAYLDFVSQGRVFGESYTTQLKACGFKLAQVTGRAKKGIRMDILASSPTAASGNITPAMRTAELKALKKAYGGSMDAETVLATAAYLRNSELILVYTQRIREAKERRQAIPDNEKKNIYLNAARKMKVMVWKPPVIVKPRAKAKTGVKPVKLESGLTKSLESCMLAGQSLSKATVGVNNIYADKGIEKYLRKNNNAATVVLFNMFQKFSKKHMGVAGKHTAMPTFGMHIVKIRGNKPEFRELEKYLAKSYSGKRGGELATDAGNKLFSAARVVLRSYLKLAATKSPRLLREFRQMKKGRDVVTVNGRGMDKQTVLHMALFMRRMSRVARVKQDLAVQLWTVPAAREVVKPTPAKQKQSKPMLQFKLQP